MSAIKNLFHPTAKALLWASSFVPFFTAAVIADKAKADTIVTYTFTGQNSPLPFEFVAVPSSSGSPLTSSTSIPLVLRSDGTLGLSGSLPGTSPDVNGSIFTSNSSYFAEGIFNLPNGGYISAASVTVSSAANVGLGIDFREGTSLDAAAFIIGGGTYNFTGTALADANGMAIIPEGLGSGDAAVTISAWDITVDTPGSATPDPNTFGTGVIGLGILELIRRRRQGITPPGNGS